MGDSGNPQMRELTLGVTTAVSSVGVRLVLRSPRLRPQGPVHSAAPSPPPRSHSWTDSSRHTVGASEADWLGPSPPPLQWQPGEALADLQIGKLRLGGMPAVHVEEGWGRESRNTAPLSPSPTAAFLCNWAVVLA